MELTSSYRLGREVLARPIQIKNACPASEGEKNRLHGWVCVGLSGSSAPCERSVTRQPLALGGFCAFSSIYMYMYMYCII